MLCGVYLLGFNNTCKVYVGKSLDISTRFRAHCYNMLNGTHSRKMMTAYAEFGLPNTLEIEIECAEEDSSYYEDYYINLWNSVDDGFNTVRSSTSGPKLYAELNGKSLYTREQVLKAFSLLLDIRNTFSSIAVSTGIAEGTLRSISQGALHRWIQHEYPEDYALLMSLVGTRNSYSSSAKGKGIVYPNIISPEGVVYNVENTKQFSKIHSLSQGNLHQVLTGKKRSCKGWTLQIS